MEVEISASITKSKGIVSIVEDPVFVYIRNKNKIVLIAAVVRITKSKGIVLNVEVLLFVNTRNESTIVMIVMVVHIRN